MSVVRHIEHGDSRYPLEKLSQSFGTYITTPTFYRQPETEVVGKVSLVVVYHLFYSGATEIPQTNLFGCCTPIPHPPNVEISTDNFSQTKSNIVKGKGREGRRRVKLANLPNTSVYGCSLRLYGQLNIRNQLPKQRFQ